MALMLPGLGRGFVMIQESQRERRSGLTEFVKRVRPTVVIYPGPDRFRVKVRHGSVRRVPRPLIVSREIAFHPCEVQKTQLASIMKVRSAAFRARSIDMRTIRGVAGTCYHGQEQGDALSHRITFEAAVEPNATTGRGPHELHLEVGCYMPSISCASIVMIPPPEP